MRIPAELYASLRQRIAVFSHKSKSLRDGDVEGLHRARVASRRLRELLPVLRLEAPAVRKLGRKLRKVTRVLGEVRDFDVLIGLIAELHHDRRHSKIVLDALQAAVEEQRTAARERLDKKLPSRKLDRLTRRLKRMAKQLETDGASDDAGKPQLAKSVVWAIDARAARRAEDVREAIHAAGTVYVPGPLHQVRIALKKLRFALELKAEAHHKPATREIATLKRSQDLLGRLHDLQVLIEHARKLPVSRPGPDPAAGRDLASLVRLLERDCRKLHARYLRNASTLVSIAEAVGSSRALAARLARREWRGERQLA